MCEFCVQHGEGKVWYLAMQNYSRALLDDDARLDYLAHFANDFEQNVPPTMARLEWLSRTPLHGAAKPWLKRTMQRDHYGQVVPMEDVEQILSQVDGIARLPCVCRRVTTGQREARYCYALTGDPRLAEVLDDSFSLEYLTPAEAISAVRRLDQEGLVHSVWTFKTPFIGALCNCDQDCIAYRICHSRGYFQLMFRAEYVARVDPAACNGCKQCLRQCQFGAIRYSAANKKAEIDARQCYGCGVCRAACTRDAIGLHARAADPVAAGVW
jgi:ferredoxin